MPLKYISCFYSYLKGFRIIRILITAAAAIGITAVLPSDAVSLEKNTFKYGFNERIRQTYLKDAFDLDKDKADDTNYIRLRSQLWGSWKPDENFELYARICNENRRWLKSASGIEDEDFEINELILENLYIDAARIWGSNISIKAGRQNIMYGEGFLMMDGGPLDGSRTAYFNAVRLKAEMEKRYFEFHFISDLSWDRYLPVVNSQHKALIEQNERGAGVYYTDNSLANKKIEAYYFYKSEEYPGSNYNNIHTTGGRLSGGYGPGGSYAAEFAIQLGDNFEHNRLGMGGYANSSYKFSAYMNPSLSTGFIYLSGDNPKTDKFEGWNPLYGRWPKWSDLYIFQLASFERGVAYWENLMAADIKLSIKPVDNIDIAASLYYMKAPQKNITSTRLGTGNNRGVLSTIKVKWSYTDYLSGHLMWEHFNPGDYYLNGADPADFLRFELAFKY